MLIIFIPEGEKRNWSTWLNKVHIVQPYSPFVNNSELSIASYYMKAQALHQFRLVPIEGFILYKYGQFCINTLHLSNFAS